MRDAVGAVAGSFLIPTPVACIYIRSSWNLAYSVFCFSRLSLKRTYHSGTLIHWVYHCGTFRSGRDV